MATRDFLVAFVLMSLVCVSSGFFGEWGPDLAGPWCATRPRGQDCCTGRDDDCSVPILGTTCYCDIFCNETAYDCCPDYWPHCHGMSNPTTTPRPTTLPPPRTTRRPIETCIKDGRRYYAGERIKDNCNDCICQYDPTIGAYAMVCTDDVCLIRPELIEAVNDGPYTWVAKNYSKFWGMTLGEGVRYRLGTFLPHDEVRRMTSIRVLQDDSLPEEFDAREKWPGLLNPVRDQGNCASSWAHSTTAVASDRLSIETDGDIKDEMSAQHLLSCNTDGQLGCQGGHLDRAWRYLWRTGVVTEQCYPYTSGKTEETGECIIKGLQKGGLCPSGIEYKTDLRYRATPPYRIRPEEREIMKEIMDNGPVQATFQVREDFFMYSRGIYSYSEVVQARAETSEAMKSGFHSVRIIGWGAERNDRGDIIKYWLCANSWGSDWGENGYFRIRRGFDESAIESYVVGVWGKITGDSALNTLLEQKRRQNRDRSSRRARRHLRHLITRSERRKQRRRLRELSHHQEKPRTRSRRGRRHHDNKNKNKNKKKNKNKNKHKKTGSYKKKSTLNKTVQLKGLLSKSLL